MACCCHLLPTHLRTKKEKVEERAAATAATSRKLFILGVSEGVSEAALRAVFGPFGGVVEARNTGLTKLNPTSRA